MGQDRKVRDTIHLEEFDIVNGPRRIFWPEEGQALNEAVFLYLKKGEGETVLDFYQSPVTMVSGLVRQVFAMYEEDIRFKRVYLVDRENKVSHNFYIPLIPRIDALSPRVERYPDGREKRVILDGSPREGPPRILPGRQHVQASPGEPCGCGEPAAQRGCGAGFRGSGGGIDGGVR